MTTGNSVLDALLAAAPTPARVRTRSVPARKHTPESQPLPHTQVEVASHASSDETSTAEVRGAVEQRQLRTEPLPEEVVWDEVVRVRAALLARAALTSLVAELVSTPPQGVSAIDAVRVARWLDDRIPRLET